MTTNWDDLKVLLAISRAGTLTGGAQLLGIDQSTAGRRLAALEADLGAILFIRSKLGFTPTAAGQAAIARALEIEGRAQRLADEVANADQGPSGLVRIVGNPWTLMRLAETALPVLLRRHPRLEIRTIGGSQPRSLARGDAVLALWFEIPPNQTEFAVRLGEVPYAIYKPRGADAAALPWVSFWDDDAPRRAPCRWIEQNRPAAERISLTATDSSVLRAGIRAGLGKGLLPMCLAEGDALLERVTAGPPDLVRALHLHAHPDTIQTARIQATMAWLRESFAQVFTPCATPPQDLAA
ncbi:LysR family transcriptional regulator [Falsiroseomonas oryzae]|uniref:LysR family transcriptional regulator n=1 Tax=Falsiroseomonas oryzae TaxID=2766473 RepID=UPI0022EB2C86|nr:LysR family transcriptional regulator [Roseomonas sp. MO-31]